MVVEPAGLCWPMRHCFVHCKQVGLGLLFSMHFCPHYDEVEWLHVVIILSQGVRHPLNSIEDSHMIANQGFGNHRKATQS